MEIHIIKCNCFILSYSIHKSLLEQHFCKEENIEQCVLFPFSSTVLFIYKKTQDCWTSKDLSKTIQIFPLLQSAIFFIYVQLCWPEKAIS